MPVTLKEFAEIFGPTAFGVVSAILLMSAIVVGTVKVWKSAGKPIFDELSATRQAFLSGVQIAKEAALAMERAP